jgi:hypothetical protein
MIRQDGDTKFQKMLMKLRYGVCSDKTFERLSNRIRTLNISSRALLDCLVELIFEKAIYEQNFSNLYADLCSDLERQSSTWSFINTVYDQDSHQYYWIADLPIDLNLAGPYQSIQECLSIVTSIIPPITRPIPTPYELKELIVSNNILIKIYKDLNQDNSFFASFTPISEELFPVPILAVLPILTKSQKDLLILLEKNQKDCHPVSVIPSISAPAFTYDFSMERSPHRAA